MGVKYWNNFAIKQIQQLSIKKTIFIIFNSRTIPFTMYTSHNEDMITDSTKLTEIDIIFVASAQQCSDIHKLFLW